MNERVIITHDDFHTLSELIQRLPGEDHQYFNNLREKLEKAKRVERAELPPDVVALGSTVSLREVETDEEWVFTVCLPDDARVDENRISILSPLGTALLGHREGAIVEWPVPSGSIPVRIEEVLSQTEAAPGPAEESTGVV